MSGKTRSVKDKLARRAIIGENALLHFFSNDAGIKSRGEDFVVIDLSSELTSAAETGVRFDNSGPVCGRSSFRGFGEHPASVAAIAAFKM